MLWRLDSPIVDMPPMCALSDWNYVAGAALDAAFPSRSRSAAERSLRGVLGFAAIGV